ncbi:leucine-rich repeat-containing protein 4C-like [Cryptotermes secundus]|uniref:leucine-rich repeat-containing protein 4C-like n=1 Tax=Cryptotermes secundus TaxID=105785 RepID=UPI001454CD76|nr:leucine-rich repeat-containing protein 4C-like [Cryptotermes secundus]
MSGFLLVALLTTYFCIMTISVLGQCPQQCSCSVVHGTDCIKSSLTELPLSQFNKYITKLNAPFNSITMLSKNSLKDIPLLTHLNLSHNKITNVDSQAFSSLKKLYSLDLSSNNITSIESVTFMYNRQLKWLSLADNCMFRLPDKDGLYLTELLFFNISHCNIKNIPLNTFSNIRKLQELCLNNNKIISLNPEIYRPLLELQKLDLCYNALQHINGQVFSRLLKLTSLSLCHNNVSRINITLLNAVARIGDVNMEGNPWICDCDSADVYYKCAKEDNCNLNLKCAFPDNFRGRYWNVIGELTCMPPISPTTVGASSEAEAVATVHQTTIEQMLQEEPSEPSSLYWITMSLLVLFLSVCICVIVVLGRRISRKNSKRFTKDAEEDGAESCSTGGFGSRILENEDHFQQIEMR